MKDSFSRLVGVLFLGALLSFVGLGFNGKGLSQEAMGAGAELNTHICAISIPRSYGDIFVGQGRTREQAVARALRECKAFHDRDILGYCEQYMRLEELYPGRHLRCKRQVGWSY